MTDFAKMIFVAVVAIIAIVIIEIAALSQGIDGTGLAAALAGIGAIAGYVLKAFIEKIKNKGGYYAQEKKGP